MRNIYKIIDKLNEKILEANDFEYRTGKDFYENNLVEEFSVFKSNNKTNFTAIINDGGKFFRPIISIDEETEEIYFSCSCNYGKSTSCMHLVSLSLKVIDYLNNESKTQSNIHVESDIAEFLGIYDYGETYYLVYPDEQYTKIKLAEKIDGKIKLRKDIETYNDILKFLKTAVPEDEYEIKKLIVPVKIDNYYGKHDYELRLMSFRELKKIKSSKILLPNKKELKWGEDIKIKIILEGDLESKKGKMKLFPIPEKERIVKTYSDMAYFNKQSISIIDIKTQLNIPFYLKDIESEFSFENKSDLENYIKDVLLPYERFGFEIDIDERFGIKKEIFIPKLNLYINFLQDRFTFRGRFLYGKEINFYDEYKYRNYDLERKLLKNLEEVNVFLDEKGQYSMEINDFFEFLENGMKKLDKNIIIKMNRNIKFHEVENIKMQLNMKNSWFDVEGSLELKGNKRIDISYLRNRKNNFIVLKDETFIKIPEYILEKLEDLKVKKEKITVESYNIYSLLNSENIEIDTLDEKTKKYIEKVKSFEKIKEYEIPELKIPMRKYQIEGYRFLRYLQEYNFNGILADDMGLGKTLQTIALILSLKRKDRKFLIIAPRSVIYNWANEIDKFTSNIKYYIYHNSQKDIPEDTDVIITTYNTLRNSIEELKKTKYFYIILDEAQFIKNDETKLYKAIRKLKSNHKLALTGTPLENSLTDLYNIFEFLMPGFFGNKKDFLRKYNYANKESIERLKKKIHPFILRRTKENVLKELPPKTEEYIFNEMTQHQKKIYHQIAEEYRQKIAMSQGTINFSVLEGLLRLRQIVNHPKLLGVNIESSKFNMFKNFIKEVLEENHKIVIFSQFVKMIEIMEEWLEKEKIQYLKIIGKTKKRVEIVEEFNNTNNIKILLVSLKAGGTGLNITGADYVIHYDPWWNPAVENQATDRVYRIGQNKPVFVYKFITRESIEEKIMKLKEAKEDLYNLAISTEKGVLKNLSREDIYQLFE
ncbi:DNA/RNA helicase, superfamily II, SNF2 family [Marinitoga piezophila KA3]|uniref:DNA/RNA helicase, superfamily II, SNF2 family n=1 Tax=Marinitoga piezophila (strain DSM 14283 / JCM 11233 / KA3) TaxID=443254 RepID=H2J5F3_MARPK|nr:DEAD/DEAH box helicase [Marinitoga piezophila]AEX86097.1 DNA/RNA helicase, superfamily II, SNF2 family [Marinitoga piezophila KA3]